MIWPGVGPRVRASAGPCLDQEEREPSGETNQRCTPGIFYSTVPQSRKSHSISKIGTDAMLCNSTAEYLCCDSKVWQNAVQRKLTVSSAGLPTSYSPGTASAAWSAYKSHLFFFGTYSLVPAPIMANSVISYLIQILSALASFIDSGPCMSAEPNHWTTCTATQYFLQFMLLLNSGMELRV